MKSYNFRNTPKVNSSLVDRGFYSNFGRIKYALPRSTGKTKGDSTKATEQYCFDFGISAAVSFQMRKPLFVRKASQLNLGVLIHFASIAIEIFLIIP